MRRVWVIRAGGDAEQIDAMRLAGVIAMREPSVEDVGLLSRDEVAQGLVEAGRGSAGAQVRAKAIKFAHAVRPGDLVVSPNARRREVWLGVVAGDYRYEDEPSIAGYNHTRGVEWMGWLDRDAAWMKDQLKSLEQPAMMYELPSREWWWRQVDTREPREFSKEPRAARSVAAGAPRATSSTPRVRKPATPKVPVRKPPIPMVRCAGTCGFQWAPSSLVNGLCNDCRADL